VLRQHQANFVEYAMQCRGRLRSDHDGYPFRSGGLFSTSPDLDVGWHFADILQADDDAD
jgi:hypothetical protein